MADQGFKRKLSAILSADVKGYSKLMGDNEEATVRTLKAYRSAINDLAQQYRGRIVDSPGDNILAEFGSVVDAVNCAVEIQRELAERNAELSENRKMAFRIGVNLGDVIEEEGRIYGDGVNIAARVESLAEPGGICISGRAYDQVENKLGLKYENLGEHQVKNIARPIRVYKVLFDSAPEEIESGNKLAFNLPKGPSIAVLPFNNMSKDPDQEYICDGITETIITVLSHIHKLLVIARNSVFAYKGKPINIKKIGQELGAQYVLEGSVQKSEDRIRITAQLIDTKSGHHLWSERYDRELKGIFKLQDEIALRIAKAMQINITEGEVIQAIFESIPDIDVQTYFKFLRAGQNLHKTTKESIILTRKETEELVAMHPEVSQFYSLLGQAYFWEIILGTCKSNQISFRKATEAARKALSLDANNSDAHILACCIFGMRKEYDKAITEAKTAIMLNPNNHYAYWTLGVWLILAGRPDEAIGFLKKAICINPIPHAKFFSALAWAYLSIEQYEKAIEMYKKSVKRKPDWLYGYLGLAQAYYFLGRKEKAMATVKEILNIDPDYSIESYKKMFQYGNQNQFERAVETLRELGLPGKLPSFY